MASGLRVNLDKSKMFCSPKVSRSRRDAFTALTSIKSTSNLGKYLGVKLSKERSSRSHFNYVLKRIDRRLSSWKMKMLNKAGKLCLVKSVLTSLPVYDMQVAWLPDMVCDKMDQACRRFLWSKDPSRKGWHLVNWGEVTNIKSKGGLGVREVRKGNVTLLGKLVWRLLTEPTCLWVQ